jgi:trans-cinnamate 4-monooxygenase
MDLLFVEKLLVALVASVVVAIAVSKIRGRKLRLPPGPVPLPIFGNWLQVGDDLNHRNLAALARRFGDVFLLRMGRRNVVVVSSPALAREVLHARGAEFGSRGRNVVFDVFTDGGQDMVFAPYGDHWRTMRRVMTPPFFASKVVQRYSAGWEAEAAAVVDAVRADPGAASEGVVLRRYLQLMMYNNNMYRLMFGRRFDRMDDPLLLRLRELNGERSRLAQSFEYNYGDFIPVLRPLLRGYLRICREVKEARLKLYKDCFVDERRCAFFF